MKGTIVETRKTHFRVGRDNFALTVFMPVDCGNACPFCTSKKDYALNKPNLSAVIESIRRVAMCHVPIKDVVITGGEPLADLKTLDAIASTAYSLFNGKVSIYINTCLPDDGADESISYINSSKIISGVNISRHLKDYFSSRVADDSKIGLICKPIHINCVLFGDFGDEAVKAFAERYAKYGSVVFRADYRTIDSGSLKSFDSPAFRQMDRLFGYIGSSGCHVCNTDYFARGGSIALHRGTEQSSIEFNDFTEVNDLIVKQDGELRYDWGEGRIADDVVLLGLAGAESESGAGQDGGQGGIYADGIRALRSLKDVKPLGGIDETIDDLRRIRRASSQRVDELQPRNQCWHWTESSHCGGTCVVNEYYTVRRSGGCGGDSYETVLRKRREYCGA